VRRRGALAALAWLLAGCAGVAAPLQGFQAATLIGRAEARAQAGQYAEAEQAYREALAKSAGAAGTADHALLGLGRLYAHPANPRRDFARAAEQYDRLLAEYPGSRWTAEARAARDLLATVLVQQRRLAEERQEIERLRRDLDRLREIETDLARLRRSP